MSFVKAFLFLLLAIVFYALSVDKGATASSCSIAEVAASCSVSYAGHGSRFERRQARRANRGWLFSGHRARKESRRARRSAFAGYGCSSAHEAASCSRAAPRASCSMAAPIAVPIAEACPNPNCACEDCDCVDCNCG
jgi:hypothetical protein